MKLTALAPITLTLALGLALSGCATGQSVADGCAELETASQTVADGVTEATGDLTTDPDAAAAAISATAKDFESDVADIENTEVREAAAPVVDAISGFAVQIEAYAADPENADTEALTASSDEVDSSFTKIGDVCS